MGGKLVEQREMHIERMCGATFAISIFELKLKTGKNFANQPTSYPRHKHNPLLEPGNLGTSHPSIEQEMLGILI